MKDYQNDKYENFFLHLKAAREVLAQFAEFTATAVAAPNTDDFIAEHAPGLAAATAALRAEMVTRRGQDGSAQTGTEIEQAAFKRFRAFIQETDVRVLKPYLLDHAGERTLYYPDKLTGLTQAPVNARGTRLTAYVKALQAAPDDNVKDQAVPATNLLRDYHKAVLLKTKTRTDLQETLADLGPAALAVAEALFDVHTAACYVHRRAPREARRYFDYARLPNRTASKKPDSAGNNA